MSVAARKCDNDPLLAQAIEGLRGGEGAPYQFDPVAVEALARALDEIHDGARLSQCVRELWFLAAWLGDERSSPGAREVLLGVLGTSMHRLWEMGGAELEIVADVVMGAKRA